MLRIVKIKQNGITFEIECDAQNIRDKIEALKKEFDPTRYVAYENSSENGDPYLTKEEYISNIERFHADFEKMILTENLDLYVTDAKKKKNGTLHKRRVVAKIDCGNTTYITDWHCTWLYKSVRLCSVSDTTLEFCFEHITDTPG